ncbi:kinase-like domain-containing protein [Lyophyllum atratum]|nr:kinase-like domain-containing protein [Lyophyllum atratum]
MAMRSRCQTASGDGCGRTFPNKDSAGLCRKCSLLSSLEVGTEPFETTNGYPQCKGCGGTWRYFRGSLCDDCGKENQAPEPQAAAQSIGLLSTQAVEAAKAARAHAMDARVTKKKTNPLHTTAALNSARASVSTTAASDKIQVSVEVRVKDVSKRSSMSTDPTFGRWGRPWAKDDYLSEVLDDSLKCANSVWEKEKPVSLIRQEVEFRFANNKVFLPGTQNATVGETYTRYMTGEHAVFYQSSDARAKAAKGPTLFLELYINKVAYDKRVQAIQGSDGDEEVEVGTRKRRLDSYLGSTESTALSSGTMSRAGKKARTDYSQLSSRFVRPVLPKRGISDDQYSMVKFIRAEASYVADTSEIEIVWPSIEGSGIIQTAHLSTTPFADGETKQVYKLMIEGKLFVAKRFFEAGTGSLDAVNDNANLLKQELIRLKQMQWFWNQFRTLAKDKDVDICQDIQVSEGFLIREQGVSSPASGDLAGLEPVVWLVEPRRTTSLVKFSGTLCHPKQDNKMGKTITAFAHFVYEISGKTLVFADIQGSPTSQNNRDGIVLFDLMTHSVDGSSGAGDFGAKGISTFLDQHKCDFMCHGLGLPSLERDKDDNSDPSSPS